MLMRPAWIIAVILLLLGCPGISLASEEGSTNLFAGDLGNAISTLLIFGLLLWVLGKFAWGPLLKALQNREKYIRESLESAKQDRESAETRLREYEEKLKQAAAEATAVLDEAKRNAEAAKRRIEEEARKSSEAMTERAKRDISMARDAALKDLYEQSAQLAMDMAGGVLKRQLSPEDQQRLVREALGELRKKVGNEN